MTTIPVIRLIDNRDVKITAKSDHNGATRLNGVIYFNHLSIIMMFVQQKLCSPEIMKMKNHTEDSALILAVRDGHVDSVKELTDFNTKNYEEQNLMEVAVEKIY